MSRKIKKKFKRKKKTLFFPHLYTYKTLLSSRRDRSRLKLLQFDFRGDLLLLCLSLLNNPHYPVGVQDRCHASRAFDGRTVGTSMTH